MPESQIPIEQIVYDPKIYPREKWSTATIERYADCLRGGDELPPVTLEAETNRLLDGIHRWKAHLAVGSKTIQVKHVKVPDGIPVKLFAASLSVRHGLAISTAERKALAREIVEADAEFNTVTLAKMLAVSDETARSYVGDMLAKRREERAAKALRLSLLGWTQAEIGTRLGVTQGRVAQELLEIQEVGKLIISQLASGLPVEEVAQRHGLPMQLVWATALAGKGDAERCEALGIKIQPYDVWNFPRCHDLMGDKHPGRIPGELIAHVLYFFTKPGDIVIDPMVGSGTTLDACLLMGRKCFGYDIDKHHERADVIHRDIATEGWDNKIAKVAMIFWDPPYYKKKDDGYVDGSISGMTSEKYKAVFERTLKQAAKAVKPGTKLAFLMSDWDDDKGKEPGIFVWDYAAIIQRAGWKLTRHIQVPLSTQQVHPDIMLKFREARRLARLERYLLIAKKG